MDRNSLLGDVQAFDRLQRSSRPVLFASILWMVAVWLASTFANPAIAQPSRVIEGRITNADGKPIKGATVEWGHFQAEKEDREVFRSDADGKYRVETIKVGPDFRLGISAAGYAPSWRDDLIPPLQDSATTLAVDFKLAAPISLRGKVVDRDGNPIEGVRVIAKSPPEGFFSSFSSPTPSYPFPGPSREATTNAKGEFLIRYLPETTVPKEDADKGCPFEVSAKTSSGTISLGKAYANIDNAIEIDRTHVESTEELEGKIRGKVLDEATEQPIENFKIVLRHTVGMREFASKDGDFLLDQLHSNRNIQMFVYAHDYAPFVAQLTTLAGNGAFVECKLKRKPGLKGVVVDSNGNPVRGRGGPTRLRRPKEQVEKILLERVREFRGRIYGTQFCSETYNKR